MRKMMIATALMIVALPAFAQSQTSPPANRNGSTPAVNAANSPPPPGAPVAGANSFTESQTKSRIEVDGFSNVSELKKDDSGVWRGKASKGGLAMDFGCDLVPAWMTRASRCHIKSGRKLPGRFPITAISEA